MLRLATFNVENLLKRFDFTGYRNEARADRVLRLMDMTSQAAFEAMETARVVALTDDMRQMTALSIAAADADIICLQEVEGIEALDAFEEGYLYRMMGAGYRRKIVIEGNDSRGIDVAIMAREKTASGEPIEIVDIRSHAALTFREAGLFVPELAETEKPDDRIFRRDCLEVDVRIGGRRLTIYAVHFKSMTSSRPVADGRIASKPLRQAEMAAVRQIISARFGSTLPQAAFAICGDMNDYTEKLLVTGDMRRGYGFEPVRDPNSALPVLLSDGFAENVMARRPERDRWTLYHTRGPDERHLCQLDYILLSPALARLNDKAVPEIIRNGQPYRTPFPPGQAVERWPRTGWDRPKASDHCPVVIEIALP